MTAARRRLLIVAPAFPPHPTPAAHRARFLARYAPPLGWDIRIISVDPAYYAELPDTELLSLLPEGLDIKRVRAFPVGLARKLGFGDLSLRSLPFVLNAVRDACRSWHPHVTFVSAPPFFTFLAARAAYLEFGVPYVLDYTDPWVYPLPAEDRSLASRAYWMDRLARLAEPAIARDAAHILAVSDATHAGLRLRQPALPPARFSALPIGFDIEDFETLGKRARPNTLWNSSDGNIHVVHPGAISPTGHETVRALLRGAMLFNERNRARGRALQLHFVGTSYAPHPAPVVAPIAAEVGASEVVDEHVARVPYIDSLNAMRQANVVVTLGSAEPHYTASKVYNCIAAGRPVLAICHEETRSVWQAVEASAAGLAVTYNSVARPESRVESVATALDALTQRGARGATRESMKAIEPFSARSMTSAVLRILEGLVERKRTSESVV